MGYQLEEVVYDRSPYTMKAGDPSQITPWDFVTHRNPPPRRWAKAESGLTPGIVGTAFQIKKTAAAQYAYYFRQTPNFDPEVMVQAAGGSIVDGYGNEGVLDVELKFNVTAGDIPANVMPFRLYMGDGVRRFTLALILDSGNNYKVGLLQGASANEGSSGDYATGGSFALANGTTYTLRLVRANDGSGKAEIYLGGSPGASATPLSTVTVAWTGLPHALGWQLMGTTPLTSSENPLGVTATSGPQPHAGFCAWGVANAGLGTYDVEKATWTLSDHNSSGTRLPNAARSIDFLVRDTPSDNGIDPSTGNLWQSQDILVVNLAASGWTSGWVPPEGSTITPGSGTPCNYNGDTWNSATNNIKVGNRVERNLENYCYVRIRNIGLSSDIKDATGTTSYFGKGHIEVYLCESTTFNDPALWTPNRWDPYSPNDDKIGAPGQSLGVMPFTVSSPTCQTILAGPFKISASVLQSQLALGGHPCLIAVVHGNETTIDYGPEGKQEFGFSDPEPLEVYAEGASTINFGNMVKISNSVCWKNLHVVQTF